MKLYELKINEEKAQVLTSGEFDELMSDLKKNMLMEDRVRLQVRRRA